MNAFMNTTIRFSCDSGEDHEIDLTVDYVFHRAVPAYTPAGEYGPIDPPEPAMAEINAVTISRNGVVLDCPGWLRELLLDDDALMQACVQESENA